MKDLYSTEVTDDCVVYVWKGVPADPRKQRPMHTCHYNHCLALANLKKTHNGLFNFRMNTIKKWFSKRDSSYANLYRHYHEVATHW